MRISIPCWQGRVSPVFDVSEALLLIDLESGREVHRENRALQGRDPFFRAREMSEMDIDVLICGAISKALENSLHSIGIKVVGFVCGDMESVVRAYIKGELDREEYRMPGTTASGRQSFSRGVRYDENTFITDSCLNKQNT